MTAPLRHHLVFQVRRGDAGVDVELDRALHVEEVAVTRVHVDDDGRDLEVERRRFLFRVAHGHGELELTQRAHGATGAVGDLDR